jgi:hypothetical protein
MKNAEILMKNKRILILIAVGFFNLTNTYAKPSNIEEWEKCVDKENTIAYNKHPELCGASSCSNQREIQLHCGNRPLDESVPMFIGVGVNSYDLVRSNAWRKKFVAITKGRYKEFVERLELTSDTISQGNWIVGEGQMPHFGGDEEAAFAISTISGQVFAVMMESVNSEHRVISTFGFTNFYEAPPFLQQWIKEKNKYL